MPFAAVNGARIHYLQQGPAGAEDLVMVHGLATNLAFWYLPYAQVFAQRFRVTLFDLRGLGRSEATRSGYAPQDLAADLGGLMDALGIARAHVVAHSHGGVVALNLAVRHPGRIASLVLCDTHVAALRQPGRDWGRRAHVQAVLDRSGIDLDTRDPHFGWRLLTTVARLHARGVAMPSALAELVGPVLARGGRRGAAQWLRLIDETDAERELMGDDGLGLDALQRLLLPILALYADHSQARATGAALLDVWPHAEFRRMRDAGHFFPASRPADVVAECERFWRGDYPRRPLVRAGEAERRHFRSDRVFFDAGGWHYTTREQQRVGPFASADAAHMALAGHIAGLAGVAGAAAVAA